MPNFSLTDKNPTPFVIIPHTHARGCQPAVKIQLIRLCKPQKIVDTYVSPQNKKELKPCEASEAPQQSKRSAVENVSHEVQP